MASLGNWTVVFDDKIIIKQSGDGAASYIIDDNAFWSQSKYSNIWAIQYGTSPTSDEVEYKDETPHSSFADANLGSFQDFITKWDSAHLAKLQSVWDQDVLITYNEDGSVNTTESEADQIARKGSRPTSYSS